MLSYELWYYVSMPNPIFTLVVLYIQHIETIMYCFTLLLHFVLQPLSLPCQASSYLRSIKESTKGTIFSSCDTIVYD